MITTTAEPYRHLFLKQLVQTPYIAILSTHVRAEAHGLVLPFALPILLSVCFLPTLLTAPARLDLRRRLQARRGNASPQCIQY